MRGSSRRSSLLAGSGSFWMRTMREALEEASVGLDDPEGVCAGLGDDEEGGFEVVSSVNAFDGIGQRGLRRADQAGRDPGGASFEAIGGFGLVSASEAKRKEAEADEAGGETQGAGRSARAAGVAGRSHPRSSPLVVVGLR